MGIVPHIIKPAPDSHFVLLPCECGSTDVGYIKRISTPPLRTEWAASCPACGRTTRYWQMQHTAQIEWNGREKPSWDRD